MAVRFSAESQAYSTTTNVPNGTFTVTWWAYMSVDRGSYATMWEPGATSGTGVYTQIGVNGDSELVAALSDGDEPNTGVTLPVGQWWCFAVTQSGIGGVLELWWGTSPDDLDSATGVANASAAVTLRIGRSVWGGEWFNGRIASWKQWSAVLSDDEIAAELGQYEHRRASNFVRRFDFKAPQTVPSGGSGSLTGGTGATTESGPAIPDSKFVVVQQAIIHSTARSRASLW